MSKVASLLKTMSEKKEAERVAYLTAFRKLFDSVNRKLTYNRNWYENMYRIGFSPWRPMVTHEEHRLILQHGEVFKMENFPLDVLAMGTPYGLVVISSSGCEVNYEITETLAAAWERGYGVKPKVSGKLSDVNAPHFLNEQFFAHVAELAEQDRAESIEVGDGMKLFPRPAKKHGYNGGPNPNKKGQQKRPFKPRPKQEASAA